MENNFLNNDPKHWKWGIFYKNAKDDRLIVPKRSEALGWTLNFAHTKIKIALAVLILLIIIAGIYQ